MSSLESRQPSLNKPWTDLYTNISQKEFDYGELSATDPKTKSPVKIRYDYFTDHTHNIYSEIRALQRLEGIAGFPRLFAHGTDPSPVSDDDRQHPRHYEWLATEVAPGEEFNPENFADKPPEVKLRFLRSYLARMKTLWSRNICIPVHSRFHINCLPDNQEVFFRNLSNASMLPERQTVVFPEFAQRFAQSADRIALDIPFDDDQLSALFIAYNFLLDYGVKPKDKYVTLSNVSNDRGRYPIN